MSKYNTSHPIESILNDIKSLLINKIQDYDFSIDENFINNKHTKSTLEQWIYDLDNEKYNKMFEALQMNQNGKYLLIRYKRLSQLNINNMNEFWNAYDGLYRECRSIVIDLTQLRVVLNPFKKFFNYNEHNETTIENIIKDINNTNDIELVEKMDGSMISARYLINDDKLLIATSTNISDKYSWRLKKINELFENELYKNYVLLIKKYPDYTFIFEYVYDDDKHVIEYNENFQGIYLLGMRHIDGTTVSYESIQNKIDILSISLEYDFNAYMILSPFKFQFKNIDNLLKSLKENTNSIEGYVLRINDKYIKFKYDLYINLHKIMISEESMGNSIISSIVNNHIDDIIPLIKNNKQLSDVYDTILNYIAIIDTLLDDFYNRYNNLQLDEYCQGVNTFPKFIRGYAINKYKNIDNSYLISRTNKIINYTNLVSNYNTLLEYMNGDD